MMKRFAPVTWGVFAMVVGTLAGCSDSALDPSTGGAASKVDAYMTYQVDATSVSAAEASASFDEIVLGGGSVIDPSDSNRGPRDTTNKPPRDRRDTTNKPPRDPRDTTVKPPRDTTNKPPRDTAVKPPVRGDSSIRKAPDRGPGRGGRGLKRGQLNPRDYKRVIAALKLTPQQDSLVRICFEDARAAQLAAQQTYLSDRRALDSTMRAAVKSIRQAVADGTMTQDDATAALAALKATYATDAAALNAAYKAALESANTALDGCIRGHLTDEQIAIWDRISR